MSKRIVIINNTFPYKGESFLKNELDLTTEDQYITLFPIHIKKNTDEITLMKSNLEVSTIASTPSILDYGLAIINSVYSLIVHNEISATFNKKNPLRNIIKALKFSVFSECRVRTIEKWLKRNHSDEIFVFYSYWMYESAYIATRLGEIFPNSKVVTRCHGYDLYEERHRNGYLPYRTYIMNNANKIYTISENGKEYLNLKYQGQWDNKIETMRLGTLDYSGCVTKKDKRITLVSCSNLVHVKRVDRIIEALSLCEQLITWYHIGDGPLNSELVEMANKLPNNIKFRFLGHMENSEIMQFYQEYYVDAFLNVSESEGVPVSIMEALSFGIPTIATNVGGTKEIVLDHINGILLNENFESQQLLNAIIEITKESTNEFFRENSKRVWSEKCNATKNYKYFYKVLTSI